MRMVSFLLLLPFLSNTLLAADSEREITPALPDSVECFCLPLPAPAIPDTAFSGGYLCYAPATRSFYFNTQTKACGKAGTFLATFLFEREKADLFFKNDTLYACSDMPWQDTELCGLFLWRDSLPEFIGLQHTDKGAALLNEANHRLETGDIYSYITLLCQLKNLPDYIDRMQTGQTILRKAYEKSFLHFTQKEYRAALQLMETAFLFPGNALHQLYSTREALLLNAPADWNDEEITQLYSDYCRFLYAAGEWEKAIQVCSWLSEAIPGSYRHLLTQADALYKLGDTVGSDSIHAAYTRNIKEAKEE